jgi:hypothetical protein
MSYVKHHYNYFQLIGYEVPTQFNDRDPGKDYKVDFKVDKDKNNNEYLPVPDLENKDATVRLKRLAGVVHQAKIHKIVDKESSSLKIFMAPEFFFRPPMKTESEMPKGKPPKDAPERVKKVKDETGGSYTQATKNDIVNALRTMFVHDDFTDWLFVPGTIIWQMDPEEILFEISVTTVRNTAVIIKGGHPEAPFTTADKVHFSQLDGVYPNLKPEKNIRLRELVEDFDTRRKSIVDIDNLRFGVEICKDHGKKEHVLKSTTAELAKEELRRSPLHFHLLTTCGVPITPTSVAAVEGGYILRVEGHNSHPPYSQMGRVTKQVYKDIEWIDSLNDKTFESLEKQQKVTEVKKDLQFSVLTTIPLGPELQIKTKVQRQPQRIKIFPAMSCPPTE